VTIQGFGNVGSFTAKFLNDLKIRVVGVSDVSGFVYDRDGLDIPQLMKDMEGKEKLADLSEIKNGSYDISDKDRIFEVGADVFIPAAMTGVINDRTAPKILDQGTKVIVEAANIPTTPSADQYLIDNGLLIIPDFLANSGGVIGSFVEYQGRTEKEAFDLISYKIAKNVKQSLADSFLETGNDSTKDPEVNVRKVATESSKQKVYRAMLLRKGAINVAREAYARK
jgi:glutamate dehydrogenase (NAD(P)+)